MSSRKQALAVSNHGIAEIHLSLERRSLESLGLSLSLSSGFFSFILSIFKKSLRSSVFVHIVEILVVVVTVPTISLVEKTVILIELDVDLLLRFFLGTNFLLESRQ